MKLKIITSESEYNDFNYHDFIIQIDINGDCQTESQMNYDGEMLRIQRTKSDCKSSSFLPFLTYRDLPHEERNFRSGEPPFIMQVIKKFYLICWISW